ncbi:MAG: hypothetical protein H6975_07240 [Gammaproteobacteria bacterium]|nr:hypothetical protein [Gammaproteobacteria bacterium]
MLIEQLYWKTLWSRTVRSVESSTRYQGPSAQEYAAFQRCRAKRANAQFITYARSSFALPSKDFHGLREYSGHLVGQNGGERTILQTTM